MKADATACSLQQAPTMRNFTYNRERQARIDLQAQAEAEAAEEAARQAEEIRREQQEADERNNANTVADDTFATQLGNHDIPPSTMRGGPVTRGRGRGRAVASSTKSASQKQKDQLIKFAQPIIATMPIDFREKQVGLCS